MIVAGEAPETDDEAEDQPSHLQTSTKSETSASAASSSPRWPSAAGGAWGLLAKARPASAGGAATQGQGQPQGFLDSYLSAFQFASLDDDGNDDDPAAGKAGSGLLNQKLVQKNKAVHEAIDAWQTHILGQVPEKTQLLLESSAKTQGHYQDAVLCMQQANHFCAEATESMEEFSTIASDVNWPK